MGLLPFAPTVTLDGRVDHEERIADAGTHACFTGPDASGAMRWGRGRRNISPLAWVAVLSLGWGLFAGRSFARDEKPGWPQFRGIASAGVTAEPVLRPGQQELEVVWSTPIRGAGYSSPVIHDGTVFLSTAYRSPTGRLIFLTAWWGSILSVAALLGATLLHHSSPPATAMARRRAFLALFHVGALFILVMSGRELFGTNNDTLRTCMLHLLIAAVALNTARILAREWRPAQITVASLGVLASVLSAWHLLTLPAVRLPVLMFAACLAPLFPAILCFRSAWPAGEKIVAALCAVVPLSMVALFTWIARGDPFWAIQPVHTLRASAPHLAAIGLLCSAGLILLLAARRGSRPAMLGVTLLAGGCLFAVPVAASPLINSFHFLKYHLVRGVLGSPLGESGVVAGGVMMAAATTALFLPTRWAAVFSRHSRLPTLLTALPLLGGLLTILGDFGGNSGEEISALVAVDADSGEVRWVTEGLARNRDSVRSSNNSSATPTPLVTDGRVIAYFGNRGAFACQGGSGRLLWTYEDLNHYSDYGPASSPVPIDSGVVIQSDSERIASFATALSLVNGRPLWRYERVSIPTWRTPVVIPWKGREILCVWGRTSCDFLDAKTGTRICSLWGFECSEGDPIASPVIANEMIFFAGTEELLGLSLARLFEEPEKDLVLESGKGPPAELGEMPRLTPDVSFALKGDGPTCSTPVFAGGMIHGVSDAGTLWSFSLKEKRMIWKTELEPTKSSPIVAAGFIYVVNDAGTLQVFRIAEPEPVRVTTLDLKEQAMASPAVYNGTLFVRTKSHLFRIRAKNLVASTGPGQAHVSQ